MSQMIVYEIWECQAQGCKFRFPVGEEEKQRHWKERCPRCGDSIVMKARYELPAEANQPYRNQPEDNCKVHFAGLLDNIRSAWNVGSMLRSADGAGFQHLYLCGITPTPHHPKVVNTSLGAEESISWSYHPNSVEMARELKAEGKKLAALECGAPASRFTPISIFSALPFLSEGQSAANVVLMVGNEKYGLDPALLDLCDRVLTIQMLGKKGSLNVAVAFGIAAYFLVKNYAPLSCDDENI